MNCKFCLLNWTIKTSSEWKQIRKAIIWFETEKCTITIKVSCYLIQFLIGGTILGLHLMLQPLTDEWDRTGSPHWVEKIILGYAPSAFILFTMSLHILANLLCHTTAEKIFKVSFRERDNRRPFSLPFIFFTQCLPGLPIFSFLLVSFSYWHPNLPPTMSWKPICCTEDQEDRRSRKEVRL